MERPSSSTRGTIFLGASRFKFIVLGGWSAIAPLSKAVSAAAALTVKGERKKIQHSRRYYWLFTL